ncbi:MAG: hypothetical protein R3336_07250 [Phycisphaeraceae bacterium]|nr:hypothetical protein [Phycisphaeraceae bacterium]
MFYTAVGLFRLRAMARLSAEVICWVALIAGAGLLAAWQVHLDIFQMVWWEQLMRVAVLLIWISLWTYLVVILRSRRVRSAMLTSHDLRVRREMENDP